MEERRRQQRTEVEFTAYISSSGSSTRCKVINLSSQGAALVVPEPMYLPNQFVLMTEHDRVTRICRVVWIMQKTVGVEFETVGPIIPPAGEAASL